MTEKNESIEDFFKTVDIFSDLDDRALQELGNLFFENKFEVGEMIFEEGSIGDAMMVIFSGEVRVSQTVGPETEEALVVLKKGDFFGEMAVLEDLPRSATTIAHKESVILEISRDYFMKFIETDNKSGIKILIKLAKIVSARLREADKKLQAFTDLTKWI
ncbi:MAG: cyclic nucleotide-binding domain-containing protein [Candidatus Aminicenantes bacterium]|nr:cyclic nucleotide-binding domain-containing protein [Candidatus Aminicenantes bacterium]